MDEEPVDIDLELRIVTAQSVWLIQPDRYLRLPRREGPRQRPSSEALLDARWHHHVGAWRVTDPIGTRYRILPAGRPPGSRGIYTGDVVTVEVRTPRGNHHNRADP